MLTVYEGPKLVDSSTYSDCKTYREAVQKCYALRTRKNISNSHIAEETGCCASHVGDYITSKPRKVVRDLPAEFIQDFEVSMGNRLITQ
jgi:hypothetical protein